MKEWWEKEAEYEARYHSGRCPKSLRKYIPEKLAEAVDETAVDSDGYWIYLSEGWTCYDGGEDCTLIHCYTIMDLKEDIQTIRKKVL